MADLRSWLTRLGLERYETPLRASDIDLEIVPTLTDQDLERLGFSLGHRRKFLLEAAKLRDAGSAAKPPTAAAAPLPPGAPAVPSPAELGARQAERRQVTVLFSDLVGSTELSALLDPEDLSRVLRQYQDTCAGAIERFGGFLAKFLGDGVLAFFGYPHADEDAPQLAVRAGLEIVAGVSQLFRPDGKPLQARIGIATGLVVVGELIGAGSSQEESIVGDTPNLAARLQALAEPGMVVASAATRRLLGEAFEIVSLGDHALKGFSQPVPVWRVLGERTTESRFAAAHRALGPLLGRDAELGMLLDRWRLASQGQGQVVLLSGEAGMGKSRLLEALGERVREGGSQRVRCQCSPLHRNSALHPVLRTVEYGAGFAPEDAPPDKLRKLGELLARTGQDSGRNVLLLAGPMGLPVGADLPALELTPAQRKTAAIALLIEQLLALARQSPVLFQVEDAHWIDPTTQVLLDGLIARVPQTPVLVVITYRPEFPAPWSGQPHVSLLSCSRLGAEACAALVSRIAEGQDLPPLLQQQIIARSDGVPLFLEELTKTMRESGMGSVAVPATLHDSLMARLDRLGPAKDVAQTAAVIGRQFDLALLATVAQAAEPVLRSALKQLADAEMILPQGGPDASVYLFKHALIQQAAYESLLRTRRQVLHERIARALEERFAASGAGEPEVLAQHYGRAGLAEAASKQWELAAEGATARSTYIEAEADLRAALEEAGRLTDETLRAQRRLELLIKLAPALFALKGPHSDEFRTALTEAEHLARTVGTGQQLFAVTWGLFMHEGSIRKFQRAKVRAEELVALGRRLNDDDLLMEGYHHRFGVAYILGEISAAVEICGEAISRYDPARHHRFADVFMGHDSGVCAHGLHSFGLGLTGRFAQASQSVEAALALAERLQHPFSNAYSHYCAAYAFTILADPEATRQQAESMLRVARKYEFVQPIHHATFLLGSALAEGADPAGGLKMMETVWDTGQVDRRTELFSAAIFARGLINAGRHADALALVNKMLAESGAPHVGFFMPEMWRLKGELLMHISAGDRAESERCLRTALTASERQGALLLQLRAATSLARLLGESGAREQAHALLQPVLGAFTEGFTHPDVAAATRLLKELP
jgi:class 3 adenylate cyclase